LTDAEHPARHLPDRIEGGAGAKAAAGNLPDFMFHDFGPPVSLCGYNAFGTPSIFGFSESPHALPAAPAGFA